MTNAEDELALSLDGVGISYRRQYYYAKPRKFQADFWVVGTRILIEVNGGLYRTKHNPEGGAHGSVKGILADIERLNQATLNHYYMLRFTPAQVKSGEALDFIQKVVR